LTEPEAETKYTCPKNELLLLVRLCNWQRSNVLADWAKNPEKPPIFDNPPGRPDKGQKRGRVRETRTYGNPNPCCAGAAAAADMESRYGKLVDVVGAPECVQCGSVWTTYWRHDPATGHYLCSTCSSCSPTTAATAAAATGFYQQHKALEHDLGRRLLQTRASTPACTAKQLLNLPAVSINRRSRVQRCSLRRSVSFYR